MIDFRNQLAHSKITDENRIFVIEEDGFEFVASHSPIWRREGIDLYDVKVLHEELDEVIRAVLAGMKKQAYDTFGNALENDHIRIDSVGRILPRKWDPRRPSCKIGLE